MSRSETNWHWRQQWQWQGGHVSHDDDDNKDCSRRNDGIKSGYEVAIKGEDERRIAWHEKGWDANGDRDGHYHDAHDDDDDDDIDDDSLSSSSSSLTTAAPFSPPDVIRRIERVVASLMDALDEPTSAELVLRLPRRHHHHWRPGVDTNVQAATDHDDNDDHDAIVTTERRFNSLSQSRSFANVLLVLSYCHSLLLSGRTTTNREVYYFHVTHFRSQRECDSALWDAARVLDVPRTSLGIAASPRGWFCGCVEITRPPTTPTGRPSTIDGTALPAVQGLPITREWIDRFNKYRCPSSNDYRSPPPSSSSSSLLLSFSSSSSIRLSAKNGARCILVIEKEGVYARLSEDRFYDRYPCILVTGRGFPDLATRALVRVLHDELNLPVYGLCDCNPYGYAVLSTYRNGSERMGWDGGGRYGVPIGLIGLRPSQVERLGMELPRAVYQDLTALDRKKIDRLVDTDNNVTGTFVSDGIGRDGGWWRREELRRMARNGWKVELESLHWLGHDFLGDWLEDVLLRNEEREGSENNQDDKDANLWWRII